MRVTGISGNQKSGVVSTIIPNRQNSSFRPYIDDKLLLLRCNGIKMFYGIVFYGYFVDIQVPRPRQGI